MINYYNLLKTIYTKDYLVNFYDVDDGLCIALTHTLSKDEANLECLGNIIKYLFYVPSITYLRLLYLFIPQRPFVPKTIKVEKSTEKKSKLIETLQHKFNWSNKETQIYKGIINGQITNSIS